MAWKYGIVLKSTLTREEAELFDVVAPIANANRDIDGNDNGGIWSEYLSVESLNWGSRHDKVVNDSITAFNLANEDQVTTERLIETRTQRRRLGTKP